MFPVYQQLIYAEYSRLEQGEKIPIEIILWVFSKNEFNIIFIFDQINSVREITLDQLSIRHFVFFTHTLPNTLPHPSIFLEKETERS